VVAVSLSKLKGKEAWRYGYYCAVCGCVVGPEEEAVVVANLPMHAACFEKLMKLRGEEFDKAVEKLPIIARKELEKRRGAEAIPQAIPPPQVGEGERRAEAERAVLGRERVRDVLNAYSGILGKLADAMRYLADGEPADWLEASRAILHCNDFARHYDVPSKAEVAKIVDRLLEKWRELEPKRDRNSMMYEIGKVISERVPALIIADAKAVDPAPSHEPEPAEGGGGRGGKGGAEGADPPEVRILTREERRALWSKARSIVGSALKRAGLRHVGEMRVDGMAPEPYLEFLGGIREGVGRFLKEPKRVELRVYPATEKGLGRTDVFVDGDYWGTWSPPDPYVGSFRNWVHRVYNLLRDLAERDMLAVDPPAVSTGPCGMGEEELE
jgi:hypothetical protein